MKLEQKGLQKPPAPLITAHRLVCGPGAGGHTEVGVSAAVGA